MKLSKKLILTQTIALAATSSAFAASNNINKLSRYIKSGNSILAPMVSNSVNGFGVNNELFLLSQKQNGSLKDGVVYINGKLNAAVNYFNISPKNQVDKSPVTGPNQSTVLNPGLDLAITATKGWFTGFVDLSTNAGSKPFVSWCESGDTSCDTAGSINPYTGLAVFQPTYGDDGLYSKLFSPNQPGLGLLQAYLMLGDLNKMPLYFLAGRKYVDFGSFANQEQTWQPLTNLFNQNVQNQLALGFYQNGIHGAVTLFKSPWTVTDPGGVYWGTEYVNNQLSTLAATLSYGTNVKNIGLHAGVSYTSNLNPQSSVWLYVDAGSRIYGGIIFAEVNFKPITITANYGSAMTTVQSGTQNKPYAWDVGVKFDFNLMNHANWLSGNYSYINPQLTSAGAGNWLKLSQWLFGWHVELAKNVNATLQYGYQKVGGDNTDWTPVKYNFFALGANFSF